MLVVELQLGLISRQRDGSTHQRGPRPEENIDRVLSIRISVLLLINWSITTEWWCCRAHIHSCNPWATSLAEPTEEHTLSVTSFESHKCNIFCQKPHLKIFDLDAERWKLTRLKMLLALKGAPPKNKNWRMTLSSIELQLWISMHVHFLPMKHALCWIGPSS